MLISKKFKKVIIITEFKIGLFLCTNVYKLKTIEFKFFFPELLLIIYKIPTIKLKIVNLNSE